MGQSKEPSNKEKAGVEPKDLSLKAVSVAIGSILALVLITVFCLHPVFSYTNDNHTMMETLQTKLDPDFDAAAIFPEPRLQPLPKDDLILFRRQEDAILTTYGWVDRAKGKVHVPIEVAEQLVLKRGLPVRGGGNGK